jgi:hypothetical protein
VWDVASTLVSVEVPLGEDVLPPANKAAVQRAQAEDLNRTLRYQARAVCWAVCRTRIDAWPAYTRAA